MAEADAIDPAAAPLTSEALAQELRRCGLPPGRCVIVHTSLRSLGWVVGGAEAVVHALVDAVGPEGTLVMPAHTGGNSEPSHWQNPPVPEAWWPIVRASMPPFDRHRSPTRGMGVVAELFRTWPGVVRSDHPAVSFAAHGPDAPRVVADHDLVDMLGDASPLGRLYDLDALVLLLGVDHGRNTSLHLAEARLDPGLLPTIEDGAAVASDGTTAWTRFRHLDWDSDDFAELGAAYEAERGLAPCRVGRADVRILEMRPLVDWAVDWLRARR